MLEEMDENKEYHDLCPLEAYDSFSLSPELIGESFEHYDFSKFISEICKNQKEDDSKYSESQSLYYNGNYITDSCFESTDILKNLNSCGTHKKRERRKTCKFLNFTRKKSVSYTHLTKLENSPQSSKESKYTENNTEEKNSKNDSLSRLSSSSLCNNSLENMASSAYIDVPVGAAGNLPSTFSNLSDSLGLHTLPEVPLNLDNNQPNINLPPPRAKVITIPVIDGKFTADGGGVFLSSSAVVTEPLYSEENDSLRKFLSEDLHHEMQITENYSNYDISEASSPLDIDIDIESNNSCSSLLFIDESSKDFDQHSLSNSFVKSQPRKDDTDSKSMDHLSKLQPELESNSTEVEVTKKSKEESTKSKQLIRSESNNIKVGPIPPGRKRRPRVSYSTLTEEEKIQRIRQMNNDACLRYRKNKKKTIKELEKDIHELEIRNKKLHKIHDALKARKDKAEQLIAKFLKGTKQQSSKSKSVKRKSQKQKRR